MRWIGARIDIPEMTSDLKGDQKTRAFFDNWRLRYSYWSEIKAAKEIYKTLDRPETILGDEYPEIEAWIKEKLGL